MNVTVFVILTYQACTDEVVILLREPVIQEKVFLVRGVLALNEKCNVF